MFDRTELKPPSGNSLEDLLRLLTAEEHNNVTQPTSVTPKRVAIVCSIGISTTLSAVFCAHLAQKFEANEIISFLFVVLFEFLLLTGMVTTFVGGPIALITFMATIWPEVRKNLPKARFGTILFQQAEIDRNDLDLVTFYGTSSVVISYNSPQSVLREESESCATYTSSFGALCPLL